LSNPPEPGLVAAKRPVGSSGIAATSWSEFPRVTSRNPTVAPTPTPAKVTSPSGSSWPLAYHWVNRASPVSSSSSVKTTSSSPQRTKRLRAPKQNDDSSNPLSLSGSPRTLVSAANTVSSR